MPISYNICRVKMQVNGSILCRHETWDSVRPVYIFLENFGEFPVYLTFNMAHHPTTCNNTISSFPTWRYPLGPISLLGSALTCWAKNWRLSVARHNDRSIERLCLRVIQDITLLKKAAHHKVSDVTHNALQIISETGSCDCWIDLFK